MGDYDLIVIGGGVAGMSAAQRAADHGISVLLLEGLYTGGKTAKEKVTDYPGFPEGIDGEALTDKIEKGILQRGVKILHEKVTELDLDSSIKFIKTDRGNYEAKAVILALGIRKRELGLSNERALSGMGVFHSAEKEGERVSGKTVAVVGKGNEAVCEALILSELCKLVYIICPEEILGASKKYMDRLKKKDNISFCPESLIAGVDEGIFMLESMTVINRVTTEFKTVPVDAIFVPDTPEPDTDVLLGHVRMTDDGAVITGADMETTKEGVFAAGAVRDGSAYTVTDAVADGFRAADSVNLYLTR